ncbi:MAG: T9SS C-terminal target domain-containing protein [Euryarchaeota archaeon]|nr:T9SS C-terminal target domain-containing protein [Euryarchaeota archaeon]
MNTIGRGIGHDILAILDGDINNSIVLNEYYTADLNSFRSGKVLYDLSQVSEGPHSLKLRAWDVYNNPGETTIDFVVANSEDLALRHVLNYPNPFTSYTEFQFEHNRANQPLQIRVQIFSASGQLVKSIQKELVPDGNRITGITWDGRDDYGDPIGKGVYVYKLSVRSKTDGSQSEEYQKLVILR